ncbi:MAG: 5'-methylthioadenosine/S-adenosylhomocysteine nucleosidase [Clostridiales bacterium]|nr:5'-methylthioadenosine/S-adenosylhomocysteine nucleosidase [Clostridiales bacterium]
MKNIGMVVAVEMDAVLSRYGAPSEKRRVAGFEVYTYTGADYTIYALNSGAGEIAAAAATQLLISVFHADLILNFGVVGGLTEEMAKARTCVVESVVHYDFDTSEAGWAEPARYLDYPTAYIPASAALVERALSIEPRLKKVICASADKFVGSPDRKRELHALYGAEICEMEAAGIVLTCNRSGVPCLLIKTVSDGIEGGAEEFNAELQRSAALCLAVADKIIREL